MTRSHRPIFMPARTLAVARRLLPGCAVLVLASTLAAVPGQALATAAPAGPAVQAPAAAPAIQASAAPAAAPPAAALPAVQTSQAIAASQAVRPADESPDFTGLWEGRIVYRRAEVEFDLTVEIFRDAGGALLGTVDLPSERIKYRPLRRIEVQGRHLSMEFLMDSEVRGPEAVFKLQADLAPDGKAMQGVFVESGGFRPFFLDRKGDPGSDRPPERRSPVSILSERGEELKAAFNRDADRVRLVLLLSPT
jgi:hypothetical protein